MRSSYHTNWDPEFAIHPNPKVKRLAWRHHQSISRTLIESRPFDLSEFPRVHATLSSPHLLLGFNPGGDRILFRSESPYTCASDETVMFYSATYATDSMIVLDESHMCFGPAEVGRSDRLLFPHTGGIYGGHGIRSVPIDGSEAAVVLNPSGGDDFGLDPTGGMVVHRESNPYDQTRRLLATPVDRRQLTVLSTSALHHGPFRFTPTGDRVLYIAAHGAQFELWSVPLDASEPPIRLHDPLGAGEEILSFELLPAGRRAIVHGRFGDKEELRLVRTRELVPSTTLPDVFQGTIQSYVVDSRGKRVIVKGDRDGNGEIRLYSYSLRNPGQAFVFPGLDAQSLQSLLPVHPLSRAAGADRAQPGISTAGNREAQD